MNELCLLKVWHVKMFLLGSLNPWIVRFRYWLICNLHWKSFLLMYASQNSGKFSEHSSAVFAKKMVETTTGHTRITVRHTRITCSIFSNLNPFNLSLQFPYALFSKLQKFISNQKMIQMTWGFLLWFSIFL